MLDLKVHMLSRKVTLLSTLMEHIVPWMAHLSMYPQSSTFGVWRITYWEYVFGKFDGTIKGCRLTTRFVEDWKIALQHPS